MSLISGVESYAAAHGSESLKTVADELSVLETTCEGYKADIIDRGKTYRLLGAIQTPSGRAWRRPPMRIRKRRKAIRTYKARLGVRQGEYERRTMSTYRR